VYGVRTLGRAAVGMVSGDRNTNYGKSWWLNYVGDTKTFKN
jgi:hypothetical protein